VPTDHWFYSLFQSTPDLIALLLQAAAAAGAAAPRLGPDSPGNQLYRFEAVELKAVNHRLDGVLWPQRGMAGTARQPVVKLELQMQRDTRFKHRLGAQTLRFLQLHPKVRHLGPAQLPRELQLVLDEVIWISLEELGRQDQLDPLLNLLTLPVLHEPELQLSSQKILERRPDLTETVFPILMQRHPHFTLEQMMVYVKIPTQELRHSRAAQELLAEGRLEGRQQGEALGEVKATLRLLNHRCGPLSPATTARIQALPLEQLEALGLALLDFTGADDLAAWLEVHAA
jgi:predicted transposase YdaD